MRPVMTVVVGSRLHGLADENSDTDFASVVATPLRDLISPFRNQRVKQTAGETDHVTYELRDFCKLATQGNPTILEVLWSDRVEENSVPAILLRANREKLLRGYAVFSAHRGYAWSQRKRIQSTPSDRRRVGKAAAAYIRVLTQGIQLLKTGDFSPRVLGYRDLMLSLKRGADLDYVKQVAYPLCDELERELERAYLATDLPTQPDVDWIERYLLDVYTHAY